MATDPAAHGQQGPTPAAPETVPVMGFANPVFASGHNTSIRRGTRWLGVGQARLQLAHGRLSAPVPLQTRLRRFDQLTAAELACEHDPACRSLPGLLAVMQQHYPGFAAGDQVTVCDFWLRPGQLS